MQKIKRIFIKKIKNALPRSHHYSFMVFSLLLATAFIAPPTLCGFQLGQDKPYYIYTDVPSGISPLQLTLPKLSEKIAPGKEEAVPAAVEENLNISKQIYSNDSVTKLKTINTIRVKNHKTGAVFSISLDEYTACCVLAEMPTSYGSEALKAQAVACRTFAVNKMLKGNIPEHDSADICTDPGHCQAYISKEDIIARSGDKGKTAYETVKNAAAATSGIIMLYAGEPIIAAFHSSSGTSTASSEEVWGGKVEYLVSVPSIESTVGDPGVFSEKSFQKSELISILKKKGIKINHAAENLISQIVRTGSGRVDYVLFHDQKVTGKNLRSMLSLRSNDFTVKEDNNTITFTCVGYGHGVGMSQHGAKALAEKGNDFYEILSHYYSGITFGFVG